MSEELRVSIVVIGDEILGGYVQDTNSGWLAARLRAAGIRLERIVTVADEVDEIVDALDGEFARSRPRLILSSGGIGSTPDDRTMEAVAAWSGNALVVHPELERRVDELAHRSETANAQHVRALRRMARVPEQAELLPGVPGIAPGVVVHRDGGIGEPGGASLVVLPGVPGQLQRVMVEGIEPHLLAGRGRPQHVVELTHPYPESSLTPLLEHLVQAYPGLHLGSYPGYECVVRLVGSRDDVEAARAELVAHLQTLRKDPAAVASSRRWQERWRET